MNLQKRLVEVETSEMSAKFAKSKLETERTQLEQRAVCWPHSLSCSPLSLLLIEQSFFTPVF